MDRERYGLVFRGLTLIFFLMTSSGLMPQAASASMAAAAAASLPEPAAAPLDSPAFVPLPEPEKPAEAAPPIMGGGVFPGLDAVETITGVELLEAPTPLPYSLGRIVEIADSPSFVVSSTLMMEIPACAAESTAGCGLSAADRELATIFHFEPGADRWRRLETRRTVGDGELSLSAVIHAPGIYGAALSTASEVGNYEQPWAPTVSEAQVDLFTGSVSWSYPIDTPLGRAGQSPALALSYHSGVVDALRGDLNPQASWVGLGWNLDVGYVARRIELDENFVPRYTQDFSLVLNGVSSKLVAIGGDQYRTEDERFWRIERKPTGSNRGGDYWLVTSRDGTQYRFGYQDELAGGDSRESAWWMVGSRCDGSEALCVENWRWNLDQITDGRGNHIRLDYRVERNNFRFWWGTERYYYSDSSPCPEGAAECWTLIFHEHWMTPAGYIRGGSLEQITYSWPAAAHKVYFEVEGRTDYPTLFDSQQSGLQPVQTFWSKERLRAVVVRSNGQGELLRRYELHRDPQDSRLLQRIQSVGADGSRLPGATFSYLGLAGYREGCQEGHPEGGWKPWLIGIANGYGGSIALNYTAPENLPWFQNGQIPGPNENGKCWYRYRVREMVTNPGIGPVMRTIYEYREAEGEAPHNGTWRGDEFRGHPRVRVRQREAAGNPGAYVDVWFLQGVDGPTREICGGGLTDRPGLEGREYRRVQFDAAGGAIAQQTERWSYQDLGGGRHSVGLAAACSYPNGGEGPYSRVDYSYDGYGNLIQEKRSGDFTRPGDEVTRVHRYAYNLSAWIVERAIETRVIAADGGVESQSRTAYDGQPFGAPPTRGLPTWTAQGLESWGWISVTTRYDAWNNAEVTTDALGRPSRSLSDERFHQYPVAAVNPLGQSSRWKWDGRLNLPVEITDANGATTRFQYDGLGRLIAQFPPGQSVPSAKYGYPSGDTIPAPFSIRTETRIDPYTTPDYRRSWTIYDGLGRVIQTQQEAENGWLVVASTAYDAQGRMMVATAAYTLAAAGGSYHAPAWETLPQTRTRYDALGRIVEVVAPGNRVVRYAYRNWSRLVLDPNGHQKRYDQDGLGRLIAVYEYAGQFGAPDWNAPLPGGMRYWYDTGDHLIAIRDVLSNVTRIDYDPLGRKTGMDDPSMGHWTYRYDAVGNLIEQVDAEGQRLQFVYDGLNRLVRKLAGGTVLAEYEYDRGPQGIGRRTGMTDTTGTAQWTYDPEGRLLSESRTLGGETFTYQWRYDAAGQTFMQSFPTGEVLEWTYNRRGLPQQMRSLNGPEYLRGATYDSQGQPLTQTWGNDRTTRYSYAADTFQLRALQVSGGLLDFQYEYDRKGNLTAIVEGSNGGQVQRFGYDAWDRLISAEAGNGGEGAYQERYRYDAMGNLLSKTAEGVEQAYTYGSMNFAMEGTVPVTLPYRLFLPMAMRRCGGEIPCEATLTRPFAVVSTTGGFRAAYDRNGNMVLRVVDAGEGAVTYTLSYNAENRLAAITDTGRLTVTQYFYDGDGQLILEVERAGARVVTTTRLSDVELTQANPVDRIIRTYYRVGGQRIAMREQWNGIQSLSYLHGDHLGSTNLTTGANGIATSRARYRPFGESRSLRGVVPDYRFTGQRDAGMGLYDYRARFYDPALGRFIQADTIVPDVKNPQGFNRYAYVLANPVKYVDPTGHCYGNPKDYTSPDYPCWEMIKKIEDSYSNIKIYDQQRWTYEELNAVWDALGGHVFIESILTANRIELYRDIFRIRDGHIKHRTGGITTYPAEVDENGQRTYKITIYDAARSLTPDLSDSHAPASIVNLQGAVIHELAHVAMAENPFILESHALRSNILNYPESLLSVLNLPFGEKYNWRACRGHCQEEVVAVAAATWQLMPQSFDTSFLGVTYTDWHKDWLTVFYEPNPLGIGIKGPTSIGYP